MKNFLLRLSRAIDDVNRWIGKAAAWAIVVDILVSTLNALSRHMFGITSNGWLELQWYLFGAVFMLCGAWTLQDNEHVRIDVLSSRFSKRTREIIDIFGHLFFLFPFVAVMIWLSASYFWKAFLSGDASPNEGGLLLWPAKGLIFLGFLQLGLQWLSELIKGAFRLRDLYAPARENVSQ
ncbi:TRAP transporter small permease subunit [Cypionkella sp.]|uniref:TRAP transporter small permease subunit n=1 Tax=Cypionkella sp. TaxID=2811411 RepID=UPI002FDE22FC